MKNIKLEFSYDGSNFFGSQRQKELRTVQGEIEKAIKKVTGKDVNMKFAGRTDRGVHAFIQVANFKIDYELVGIAYKHKLLKHLPEDISILSSEEVTENFHARFKAKSKRYRYIIYNDKEIYPFMKKYKTHVKYDLDVDKMVEASKLLLGAHDFTAFMKLDDDFKDPIRSIDDVLVYRNDKDIIIEFEAKSFLYNQVRNMVGLLIDIGRGFREIEYIHDVFSGKVDRAAKTYGAEGLYLLSINYKKI